MSFTMVLAWWYVPTAITIFGLFWALFVVKGVLESMFSLAGAAMMSAVAWAIFGFLK
jgi:hypothetical protein